MGEYAELLQECYESYSAQQPPTRTVLSNGVMERDPVAGSTKTARYDLISVIGLRRLAETYAEGAAKYEPRNWERGYPNDDLLNHLLAHVVEYMAGDRSEDHLAHAAWGLFALMHFEERKPTPTKE